MGRHVVISFNRQLLKASHSFQRVRPGEEEEEVAKEYMFHHKPDTGEAATGLMPLENTSLAVRWSRAVSRQRGTCCRALGSPQGAWDPNTPGAPCFHPGEEHSQGYGADLLPLHT